MTAVRRLRALFLEIVREAELNPEFARRIEEILGPDPDLGRDRGSLGPARPAPRPHRRPPSVLDPFAVYAQNGEAGLRQKLHELDIERLKDIVAEHGMDPGKLAMKWKTPERLINLIADTVAARAKKGDAFRSPSSYEGRSRIDTIQ
jgi:hypothetical protein